MADNLLSEGMISMKGKRVLLHAEHRFVGYKSDCDYDGNATFCDDILAVGYYKAKDAKKELRRYCNRENMHIVSTDGRYAVKEPRDPRYTSEHEYAEIITPVGFLLKVGLKEGLRMMAPVSEKDKIKYTLAYEQQMSDYYDNY